MRILVTRARDQGQATAARLAAAGHEAVVAPLTRVAFDRAVALPLDGVGAVIATSTNGVEALAGRADLDALRRLPMFVVGARTARAARELGFAEVFSADGDRSDLVRLIVTTRVPSEGRLLWLAGQDRTEIFATDLRARGFAVDVVEVYRAEDVATFPPEVVAELRAGTIDAIAVYSPRSGALILRALAACGFSPASPGPRIHAISEATARGFRAVWRGDVIVAARPDEAALTETFERPRSTPVLGDPDDTSTDETRRSRMAPKRTRGTSGSPDDGVVESAAPGTGAAEATGPVTPEPKAIEMSEPKAIEGPEPKAIEMPEPKAIVTPEPKAIETSEPKAIEGAGEVEGPVVTEGAVEPASVDPTPASAPTGDPAVEAPADDGAHMPPPVPDIPPAVTPEAIAAEEPEETGNGRLIAAAVAAAIVGGALGMGGAVLMMPARDRPAIEAEISELRNRVGDLDDIETRLETTEKAVAAAKPTDLAALEARLAKIEASPALTLPADAAQRLAALEAAAQARLDAAKTSVSEAIAALPPGAQQPALTDLAGKVDAAITAAREAAAAQVARLDGKISELSTAARASGKDATEALKATVAATSAQIAAEVDKRNAEIAATLEGLRQRLGGVETLRGEVDGLIGRLGGLEVSNKEAKVDRGRIAETIDATLNGAESRVGKVESTVATLQAGAEAARQAQAEAVLAVALADLKSAVDGGRPFRGELDVVKRSAPAGGLHLEALDGFVDTGVPSVTRLRDQMPAVLRAMTEAEEARGGGEGILDRLWAHASGIVRVRPVGESAGTDLGALVSRVEARMTAGDLPGSLAAWKALPENARKVSQTWGQALEARVGVDAALAAQMSAVVSKLSQPRP